MRILHIIHSLDLRHGGPSQALRAIVQAQASAGHAVSVLATLVQADGDWLPEEAYRKSIHEEVWFEKCNLNLVSAWGRRKPWATYGFSPAARVWLRHATAAPSQAPELVHVHGVFSHITSLAAAESFRRGIPYIIRPAGILDAHCLRSGRSLVKRAYLRLLLDRELRRATFLHATSAMEASELSHWVPQNKVCAVPLGVALPGPIRPCISELLNRFPALRGKRVVLFLGRVAAKKRPELLVEALARLRREAPELALFIVGQDDGGMARLDEAVRHYGMQESVVKAGFLHGDDKQAAFAVATLFALPSIDENFGVAVVEALAHGLPALVTPGVAAGEYVTASGGGLVVEDNVAALAKGIMQILACDPRRMGEAGRKFVEQNLSWPAAIIRFDAMYREAIASNRQGNQRTAPAERSVNIGNLVADGVTFPSANAWVEGCSLHGAVELADENLLVGLDVVDPLRLPRGACLDLVPGRNRAGQPVHFIRCYHEADLLCGSADDGVRLGGCALSHWLSAAKLDAHDVWEESLAAEERSLWNARLFPAEGEPDRFRQWLWMLSPQTASAEQFQSWREVDRYSMQEIASRVDEARFQSRRAQLRENELLATLRRRFLAESSFSAADLTYLLCQSGEPERWVAGLVTEAQWHWQRRGNVPAEENFIYSRILHSLGTALVGLDEANPARAETLAEKLPEILPPGEAPWLSTASLAPAPRSSIRAWASQLHAAAFADLRSRILSSESERSRPPRSVLRTDEIVWGRAPARLDLAGGWTDTPPFALERGGQVLNAAVDLNDQPPIHVYARTVPDLVIRCRSIDSGMQQEIGSWEDLLDYQQPTAAFALPKAALAISGFASPGEVLPSRSLADMLREFGGGLELTTLAAIPKGSGLGTSSIMGAVLLATIHRVLGRQLSPRELFHAVLRLEQVMTTGGGWQDQIGGAIAGLKLVTTQPGLVPDATLRYLPTDILDPKRNGAQTLLYYTGITRLAKNILQEVVGRWLDRDREAVETLQEIGLLAQDMTEAIARKDMPEFGRLIGLAWQFNKRLDPNSTTAEVEAMLDRLAPSIHGAKLLGAGGGGFLFMVCKSPSDAARVRHILESSTPNPRSRFFDFGLSERGLAVSVC